MTSTQDRYAELVSFIRDNTNTVPWPQLEEVLRERGYSAKEITAALDEVFPGQKGSKKAGLWAGMVGALVGIVVWVIFAILYRLTR